MPDFDQPTIKDIQLKEDCIETLKKIDAKHDIGDSSKNLLAWSPLIFIASNPSPASIIFTIFSTDWEGLATCISGLEKVKLLSIANDCSYEAVKHSANVKLKTFWNAMYNYYRSQADAI